MEWSPYYETGNQKIDEAHKNILNDCSQMVAWARAGEIRKCAARLDRHIEDCRTHFDAEIELLVKFKVRDIAPHVEDHQKVLDALESAKAKCVRECSGQKCVSDIFHSFITHLLKYDLKIGDLNNAGQ